MKFDLYFLGQESPSDIPEDPKERVRGRGVMGSAISHFTYLASCGQDPCGSPCTHAATAAERVVACKTVPKMACSDAQALACHVVEHQAGGLQLSLSHVVIYAAIPTSHNLVTCLQPVLRPRVYSTQPADHHHYTVQCCLMAV
jgi:hypothetical protein